MESEALQPLLESAVVIGTRGSLLVSGVPGTVCDIVFPSSPPCPDFCQAVVTCSSVLVVLAVS